MDYELLGKKIRNERRRQDLTQEQLAEAVNVTPPYIGQVERGARGVSIENLVNICNHLGVTVDYILSDYYTKSHDEYYKGQWSKLMQGKTDSEQEFVLKIAESALENIDILRDGFTNKKS
jgi:transcriptional regulator with XRE-family HTH domain